MQFQINIRIQPKIYTIFNNFPTLLLHIAPHIPFLNCNPTHSLPIIGTSSPRMVYRIHLITQCLLLQRLRPISMVTPSITQQWCKTLIQCKMPQMFHRPPQETVSNSASAAYHLERSMASGVLVCLQARNRTIHSLLWTKENQQEGSPTVASGGWTREAQIAWEECSWTSSWTSSCSECCWNARKCYLRLLTTRTGVTGQNFRLQRHLNTQPSSRQRPHTPVDVNGHLLSLPPSPYGTPYGYSPSSGHTPKSSKSVFNPMFKVVSLSGTWWLALLIIYPSLRSLRHQCLCCQRLMLSQVRRRRLTPFLPAQNWKRWQIDLNIHLRRFHCIVNHRKVHDPFCIFFLSFFHSDLTFVLATHPFLSVCLIDFLSWHFAPTFVELLHLNAVFSMHERPPKLTRAFSSYGEFLLQVPWGGENYILVGTRSFREISTCTNTPWCSLFDARKTAKIDPHVLKLWQVFVAGTTRRGGPYLGEYQVVSRDKYMY